MSKFFLPGGAEAKRLLMKRHARFNGGSGGTPPAEEPTAEQKLVTTITERVKAELQTRGIGANLQAAVLEILTGEASPIKGMNLEALRKIDADFNGSAMQTSVTKLAGEVEKLRQQRATGEVEKQERHAPLKRLLKDPKVLDKIERAFNSRDNQIQIVYNTRAAVAMNIVDGVTVVDGDIPEDILNSFSVDSFVKKRRPSEYIFDFVTRRTVPSITEYKTWIEESGEEGAFAVISEGVVKPLVSKSVIRNTAKYRKIAGKRIYTEEFKKFRNEIYNILEDLFNDKLMRDYAAILVTSLNLAAAGYVGSALDDQYEFPTDYHAIAAVAAQIEGLDFFPDMLVINPQDKWRIGMAQDSQGRFLINIPIINPQTGVTSILGFNVVTSNRMEVGSFILGESGLYKVEDEPVTTRMGYGVTVTGSSPVTAVVSDFDNNQFRIISETFFHNYIASNHDGAFVKAAFADVKAALQAPAI